MKEPIEEEDALDDDDDDEGECVEEETTILDKKHDEEEHVHFQQDDIPQLAGKVLQSCQEASSGNWYNGNSSHNAIGSGSIRNIF